MSQEKAVNPLSRNAEHMACDSSQATNTYLPARLFMGMGSFVGSVGNADVFGSRGIVVVRRALTNTYTNLSVPGLAVCNLFPIVASGAVEGHIHSSHNVNLGFEGLFFV